MIVARLAGRCANGFERDGGRKYHLLERYSEFGKALCGAEPGRTSGGWSQPYGERPGRTPRVVEPPTSREPSKMAPGPFAAHAQLTTKLPAAGDQYCTVEQSGVTQPPLLPQYEPVEPLGTDTEPFFAWPE